MISLPKPERTDRDLLVPAAPFSRRAPSWSTTWRTAGRSTTGAALRVVDRLRRDDTLAQFARFVLVGGTTTVIYAALFLSLSRVAGLDYLPAHVAATTVTTVLANEMHRRLTFRAEDRVSWVAAQWEAGGVSVVGLVATSSALEWLDSVDRHAAPRGPGRPWSPPSRRRSGSPVHRPALDLPPGRVGGPRSAGIRLTSAHPSSGRDGRTRLLV